MEIFDYKKSLKHLYLPSNQNYVLVDVPSMNFIMIDGHGDPNIVKEYSQAVESLYSIAYGIKFAMKKDGFDFVVPPLEGLWWVPDMREFSIEHKDNWDWTIMIMMPSFVTREIMNKTIIERVKKKPLPSIDRLRFETYEEGPSAQVLYYGAYADEGPVIAALHKFFQDQGYHPTGKHHEIYLGDPRRTVPEKLKTVIRQPVTKEK